jgi:hypothetical protein
MKKLEFLTMLMLMIAVASCGKKAEKAADIASKNIGASMEKSAKELADGLEKAATGAAGSFDPIAFKETLRKNETLEAELRRINDILTYTSLGTPSLVPGSKVVFEIERYSGSFRLSAWIGDPASIESRFIWKRHFPSQTLTIFAHPDGPSMVGECQNKLSGDGSLGWLVAPVVGGCGPGVPHATTVSAEANARFAAIVSGNRGYGVKDVNLRLHTISLRTGSTSVYPIWTELTPLESPWNVVFRVYEEKDGNKEQIGTGEMRSEDFPASTLGEPIQATEVFAFRVHVPEGGTK